MGKTYIGSTQLSSVGKIKVGSSNVSKVYIGTNKVFPVDIVNAGVFNGRVSSIIGLSDDKTYVAGYFTSYSGSTLNRIAKLNSDASVDASFNVGTGFNNLAGQFDRAMAVQTDGKLIVGGLFGSYSGSLTTRAVRINTNGKIDTSFNIGVGFNDQVQEVCIQSDDKILVGGYFTTYSGSLAPKLVRLNTDGTKDTSFNIGTGFNNHVETIVQYPNNKIVVGGRFESFSGYASHRMVCLNTDGTRDASFNVGTGFNGFVNSISLYGSDKLVVGGLFTNYSGSNRNGIVILNQDGTLDTSFNIGTGFDVSPNTINSVMVVNNKIYVGGGFTTYSGSSAKGLARLNINGTKDTSFDVGTGFNGEVWCVTTSSNGNILVGGDFTVYNNVSSSKYVVLDTNGTRIG